MAAIKRMYVISSKAGAKQNAVIWRTFVAEMHDGTYWFAECGACVADCTRTMPKDGDHILDIMKGADGNDIEPIMLNKTVKSVHDLFYELTLQFAEDYETLVGQED
jgi:hypothetical protein